MTILEMNVVMFVVIVVERNVATGVGLALPHSCSRSHKRGSTHTRWGSDYISLSPGGVGSTFPSLPPLPQAGFCRRGRPVGGAVADFPQRGKAHFQMGGQISRLGGSRFTHTITHPAKKLAVSEKNPELKRTVEQLVSGKLFSLVGCVFCKA